MIKNTTNPSNDKDGEMIPWKYRIEVELKEIKEELAQTKVMLKDCGSAIINIQTYLGIKQDKSPLSISEQIIELRALIAQIRKRGCDD